MKAYMDWLRERVPSFDTMASWEKAHVKKANKIDYAIESATEAMKKEAKA